MFFFVGKLDSLSWPKQDKSEITLLPHKTFLCQCTWNPKENEDNEWYITILVLGCWDGFEIIFAGDNSFNWTIDSIASSSRGKCFFFSNFIKGLLS